MGVKGAWKGWCRRKRVGWSERVQWMQMGVKSVLGWVCEWF